MELKLKDINVCDYSKKISTTCNVEADIIVPDTKPDIYRILCVNAVCDMDERYIRKDKIIFSGNVKFDIMYIGENEKNKIYNIEYTAPFNHQYDMPGCSEDALSISKCIVSSTDFKVKNSRKLSAGCALNIGAHAMKHSIVNAIEDVTGDDLVPLRAKIIKSDSLIAFKEVEFKVSDSITLPYTGDSFEIHDFNVRSDVNDIKTVNNKAIIRGVLPSVILYSSGTELENYETEFSFTEIADLDMANAESILSTNFDISDISYSCEESSDGTVVDADITVKGYICAYETNEFTVASDIYSPDYNYDIKIDDKKTQRFQKLSESQFTLKDNLYIDKSMSDISKIYYMNIYPSCTGIHAENSSLKVSGNTDVVIIYSNGDGELYSIKKSIPFETDIAHDKSIPNEIFDASICAVNYGYILGSSNEVQVRIALKVCVDAISLDNVSLITEFQEDKNSPLDKTMQPSITVCYPDKSMSLWDYAVKYNTTCEEIASVNNIDAQKDLSLDKPLIIPKRQV